MSLRREDQRRGGAETAFGKYTLIAKIGHGGMAEVFLAVSRGTAGFTKLAVLKRLHPHLEDDALVGMFLDEARLAARLNHPNVVQTYEIGDADGLHYLAMEYLEGQSLARLFHQARAEGEPIPLAVGVRMFIDVLDGLHYAHTLRDFDGTPLHVVHRDISPGNLFATYDGQVKILDFGIAKAGTQLNETQAGQVKGKFAYIAPEQAQPGGHDHRADLWSLGVVMWEAFAGRRLFKGESEVLTLQNTLNSQIMPLDANDVPAPLAAIVHRCLQRDVDLRYDSAAQIRDDLESYMHASGLRASRTDVGDFVSSLFERERAEQQQVLRAYMTGEDSLPMNLASTTGSQSGLRSTGTGSGSLIPPVQSGEIDTSEGFQKWHLGAVLFLSAILGGALMAVFFGERSPGEPANARHASSAPALPESEPEREFQGEYDPASASDHTGSASRGGVDENGLAVGPESAEPDAEEDEPAADPEPAEPDDEEAAVTPRRRVVGPPRMRRPRREGRMVETMERAADEAPAEFGFLVLDTVPWSQVSLNGESLGTTPILRHRLPAGSHTLILVNPERGLRERYRVTIRAGETTRRRIGLE